jgi:hypothetical protein
MSVRILLRKGMIELALAQLDASVTRDAGVGTEEDGGEEAHDERLGGAAGRRDGICCCGARRDVVMDFAVVLWMTHRRPAALGVRTECSVYHSSQWVSRSVIFGVTSPHCL